MSTGSRFNMYHRRQHHAWRSFAHLWPDIFQRWQLAKAAGINCIGRVARSEHTSKNKVCCFS